MVVKLMIVILCLVVNLFEICAAPIDYNSFQPNFQFIPIRLLPPAPIIQPSTSQSNPKFVWNFVGDVITNSGLLPIEINVPDTVSNVASGAQNLAQGVAMVAGNLLQRIPFITRLTSPERPRPLRVLLVDETGQVLGMMPNY